MRPCFAFSNSAPADDTPANLSIYDEIGFWGVQASDFRAALSAVTAKTINVEINSPGGDVSHGLAIYNMLRASGKEIVVKVMGVAASAASLIAMAGDSIIMPKNTFLMVHNPWQYAAGNATELRDIADTLDKIGESLLATYVARTGMDEAEMRELLSKDTWLTADESLAMGFATEVIDEIKAKASFDMNRAELPANVLAAMALSATPEADPEPLPTKPVATAEVSALIHAAVIEAGLDPFASQWAITCLSVEDAQAKIANARTVRALCGFAKVDDKADGFIKAGTAIADVRAALIAAFVAEDEKSVVDTATNKPNTQVANSNAKPVVSPETAWASHNKGKGQSK